MRMVLAKTLYTKILITYPNGVSQDIVHQDSTTNTQMVLAKTLYTKILITYEPVTKGHDLKWDTLPQNQSPSKLFSVLPLESGMFQVTISIIKKWF